MTGVTGSPYLVLSGVQGAGATARQATYTGVVTDQYDAQALGFSYTVQPGDFSAGLGIASFELNGATVTTDDTPPNLTDTALPTGYVLAGETITMKTISFATPASGSATGFKGETLPVTISLGGIATADVSFTVTADVANKVGFTSPFTISAGSDSGTCDLTLDNTTTAPLAVTFHPQSYTGTAGDLVLTLTIVEASKPYIVSVDTDNMDDGTYTVGQVIDFVVELSGPITSMTGAPYLSLDIQNQDTSPKRATFVEYDDKYLYFTYTVQPGDFTEDLDLVKNGFVPNGANIQVNGVALGRAGYRDALPIGDAAGSLKQNADIAITTITLDDYTLARALSGREGDTLNVEVTRRGSSTMAQGFTFTVSEAGKVDPPATFSILGQRIENGVTVPGDVSANLELALVEATTAPITLRIHPNGYNSDAGDIVLTIEIAEGTKPAVLISGPAQLEEGSGIAELTVTLARPPKEATTVTLASDSTKFEFLSSTTLTWAAGDESAKAVTVQPLDGGANVTITATPSGTSYSAGTHTLYIVN